ncbi:hypothetical protein Y590_18315 [Methylobacterium sp. AMS5]|nr:hypothetical protein Y590_18315 [Methylobacterium sp. AMS5]
MLVGLVAFGLIRALLVSDAYDIGTATRSMRADHPRLGASITDDVAGAFEGEDGQDFGHGEPLRMGEMSQMDAAHDAVKGQFTLIG